MRSLLNFIILQIGWYACVVGAARGYAWAGPLYTAVFAAIHLWMTRDPAGEARLLVAVGALGAAIDGALKGTGLLTYASDAFAGLPIGPPWIIALWVLLACSLNSSFAWLRGRPLLACLLGAIFGPLSFLAGARLGAVVFHQTQTVTMCVLALVWGCAMPLCVGTRSARPA
ncbi:MAG: DUF2878 domain-containing protein [Blastocatellia bacterium]